MAALTWRDVAAPQFAGVNQAYQGAGQTLDRALSGLSEGLKQFATTNQEGRDSAILAQSMKAEDAAKMRGLLANADLSKVSPKVLETMGQRVTQLLGQASTEQSIASSKLGDEQTMQNMNINDYKQQRTVDQNQLEDDARGQVAAQLGITGPAALLNTKDQQGLAQTRSGLASAELSRAGQRISNEAGSFRNQTTKRDDAANQNALGEVGNLLSNYATTDDRRQAFEETPFASPQARALALRQIEAATGESIYAPIDAPVAGKSGTAGGKGKGKAGDTPAADPPTGAAGSALFAANAKLAQDNANGVMADIDKNQNDTRDPLTVAGDIAELVPDAKPGKIHGMIAKYMSKYPGLSAADVESAMLRSPAESYWGSTNIGDKADEWFGTGTSIDDTKLVANLESMANGKAGRMSEGSRKTRAIAAGLKSAASNLDKAKADLAAIRRRPNADSSKAEDKVDRMSQALDEAVAKQQEDRNSNPNYIKFK